jgi:hypothetical protein
LGLLIKGLQADKDTAFTFKLLSSIEKAQDNNFAAFHDKGNVHPPLKANNPKPIPDVTADCPALGEHVKTAKERPNSPCVATGSGGGRFLANPSVNMA